MAGKVRIIRPGGGIDKIIIFDAIMKETHEGDVEVTEHPVEKGGDIADHARVKLPRLVIEGLVTNTPITDASDVQHTDNTRGVVRPLALEYETMVHLPVNIPGAGAILAAVGGNRSKQTASASVLQFPKEFNRVGSVFTSLELIRRNAELVEVVTPIAMYENMIITHLTTPRDPDNGNSVRFTVELKQLRFASTEQTKGVAAVGKQNKGVQPTKSVAAESTKRPELTALSQKVLTALKEWWNK